MNSSDTRVATYLDDLARMLGDIDPGERDDVLAGIREHLDATLAEHPDDPGAVDAALLRLGPPEQVAAAARASQAPAAEVGQRPRHNPVWGRVAVIASMAAILPVLVVPLIGRVVALGAGPDPFALGVTAPELIVLLAPVWALSMLALLSADRLTGATRSRLATLGPVALIGSGFTAVWWSPEFLSSLVTIALLGTITVVTVRAGRRGWREVNADAESPYLGPPAGDVAQRPHEVSAAPAGSPRNPWWIRAAVVLTLLSTVPALVDNLAARIRVLTDPTSGAGWPDPLVLLPGPLSMVPFAPLWIVGVVAAVAAPGLTVRTRTALIATGPVCFAVLLVGSLWQSPRAVSSIACIALMLAGIAFAVAVGRRAWVEGHA